MLFNESASALDLEAPARGIDSLTEEFESRILVFVRHDEFVTPRVDAVLEMQQLNVALATVECAKAGPT